ncbi:hypothetical protein GCM10011390_48510 [Aureimonas endophytica]|uniref:NACHT domain-containing protein n=1 Tax=Aureimonas endophytica TaxID=2027858 RepID=A0A917EDS3_9HYPH|nr:NACHT domain-containing protein [Aureimonas endophytica]GGE23379.1 hypothetical protein GCM10011390_48510 [Aureimonas endophytica]
MIDTESDIRILIEMTERRDLNKVREDVNKLLTAKNALLAESGEFARCFCVVNGTVTKSMVEAGAPHKIKVVSFQSFARTFYDFATYRIARESAPFGSAVDPLTGRRDESDYVAVRYEHLAHRTELTAKDVTDLLLAGKRVVLLGEYGSGKSRCLREVFFQLAAQAEALQNYPVGIDLREMWGVKRGIELLRRHLEDLGLDALQKPAIRALNTDSLILLFDGFDELGSQSWSNDNDKLRAIRAKSLEGVKDLISRTTGGVLITGREHYFNNNEEMFAALGMSKNSAVVLRCKSEFSEAETSEFFRRLEAEIDLPQWLPRRPLICQTIVNLSEDDIDRMFGDEQDEAEFWEHFIHVLCERDARIHISFDASTIELILIQLARLTRTRPANVGPITLADTQTAFEAVVGQQPVEEAAVMLQRLPALGRVKAESNDRQFIDVYILDGLRAKDIANLTRTDDAARHSQTNGIKYVNPLNDLGQKVLSHHIGDRNLEFLQLAKRALTGSNRVLACDIVASLLRGRLASLDFGGLTIDDGLFVKLNLSKTLPSNLRVTNSVLGDFTLPSAPPPNTSFENCLAERVFGIASANAVPAWIKGFSADHYDSVESVSRIRQIGLSPEQEVLVAIIRKVFFQKGAGRKEEALTRGLGKFAPSSKVEKIINLLMREGVLERFRGNEGWVYTPKRPLAARMKTMLYELRTSRDPIWQAVSTL